MKYKTGESMPIHFNLKETSVDESSRGFHLSWSTQKIIFSYLEKNQKLFQHNLLRKKQFVCLKLQIRSNWVNIKPD